MDKITTLTAKIKRHALSVFISFFIQKDSKQLFEKMAHEAASKYRNKKNTYDYQEFLMPSWQNNTHEIEAILLAGLPFSFLRNQILKQTMFAHLSKSATNLQKDHITQTYGAETAASLLYENSAGKPILNDLQYKTSGNSIHHLYHFTKFEKETGVSLSQINSVVEFGGGYGNAAKIFKKLNTNATYTIIDIPVFSYIQYAYLSTVYGPENVVFFDETKTIIEGKINIVPLDKASMSDVNTSLNAPDLFISTWALSETNEFTQAMVKKLNYFNGSHLLLAYQKANDNFSFAQDVEDLPSNYSREYQAEIPHQKNNFYLFAKNVKQST